MLSSRVFCSRARLPNAAAMRARLNVPRRSAAGLSATRSAAAARPLPPLAPHRLHVRCLASRGGDEKSWSDIAAEAAQVGKDLAKKLSSSVNEVVGKAASALSTTQERQQAERIQRRERRQREDVFMPDDAAFGGGLVGGLIGKAVGGMLRTAVGALGEQLQQAAQQVAEVQQRAARIIESDSRLRQKLGGTPQVGPAISQSSSTSVINGRTSRRVTLLMPVAAGGRAAQAQVQYVEGESGAEQLEVAVRLPSGEVVRLDGGSATAGQTIDVDWRSVDD